MNIAGFDFGCNTDGACTASGAWPPLTEYYGHDGAGQMQHFVNNDGFNVFRLPVGWQFLTNGVVGGARCGGRQRSPARCTRFSRRRSRSGRVTAARRREQR